jgi:hypothetical protein
VAIVSSLFLIYRFWIEAVFGKSISRLASPILFFTVAWSVGSKNTVFILLKYGLHPIDSPCTMCLGYISIYSIRLINHKEEGKNEEPEEFVCRFGALFRSPSLACGVHTLDGEFRPAMMNPPHSHFQPLSYRKSLRESLAPLLPSLSGLRLCETTPKYSLYPFKIGFSPY